MKQNGLVKLALVGAFLVLMFGSCWATVQSLHRTLPEIPQILWWIGTVAFFTISSWGMKMVIDSFDQSRRVEKRGSKLVGGVLILLAFWLCFSFPTNTHTFIYMTNIKTVLADELFSTIEELKMIEQTQKADQKINTEVEAYERRVNTALEKYKAEVLRSSSVGRGKEAAKFYQELDEVLGPGEDLNHNLTPRSSNFRDLEAHNKEVATLVWAVAGKKKSEIGAKYAILKDKKRQKKIKDLRNYLSSVATKIKEKSHHNEPTGKTILSLKEAKREIVEYNKLFKEITASTTTSSSSSGETIPSSKDKKGGQTAEQTKKDNELSKVAQSADSSEEVITNVERFGSVIDVWKGIFKGEYQAKGLLFFALLALLIDIAGYIVFFRAFKEDTRAY